MTRLRSLLMALCVAGAASAAEEPEPPLAEQWPMRIGGEVLHANTLEFAGLAFRDVVARPRFDGRVLSFLGCEATAYDGRVGAEVHIDLDNGDYHVRCEFSGIDLGTVVAAFGGNNANVAGVAAGWLELDIPTRRAGSITGRGEVQVASASLVQLPLLANLLIGDPSSSKGQDSASARFECREGQIHVLAGRLVSPAARIAIKGTIGFDGDLRLYLIPRFKFDLIDQFPGLGPIVAPLLSSVTSRVARALIRGQITKPVMVINPFLRDD